MEVIAFSYFKVTELQVQGTTKLMNSHNPALIKFQVALLTHALGGLE
jgi:hypothetical protein